MELGDELSPWMIGPFVGLLLCIAILPLAAGEWFEKNRNKALVAALFGAPVVIYLLVGFGAEGRETIGDTLHEYISFIVLLTALFTISGGVYLSGDPLATPRNNITFLAVGAVLANFIGTTGAAMVLIRPVLRANAERTHMRHTVIFLIFIVCNIGGLLTPLGDPPLFLGFLRGVDFFWTLRLFPQWGLARRSDAARSTRPSRSAPTGANRRARWPPTGPSTCRSASWASSTCCSSPA